MKHQMKTNPMHPRTKRSSIRSFNAHERLNIYKSISEEGLTREEAAIRFNVKPEAIKELCKVVKRNPNRIVKKRERELNQVKRRNAVALVIA